MICRKCRRAIAKSEMWKAHVVYKNGKVDYALHNKCFHIGKRRRDLDALDRTTAPTVYEQSATKVTADDLTEEAGVRRERAQAELIRLRELAANRAQLEVELELHDGRVSMDDLIAEAEQHVALTKRQEEIAQERAKEEAPRGWTDHRDPIEREI